MSVFRFVSCVEWVSPILVEKRVVSTEIGWSGGHMDGKAGLIRGYQ